MKPSLLPPSLLSLTLAMLSLSSPTNSFPTDPPTPRPPQSSGPTPPYVLTHAPLIHLARDELYWPSSLSTHLAHTRLTNSLNASHVPSSSLPSSPLTEYTVGFTHNRTDVYLEAGVMDEAFFRGEADWLGSEYGIPDERGRSESEVVIVLVDKSEIIGPGYLDAFYFTFYSYNEGNKLFGTRFGDHIGDWEHVMIRFREGTPESIFLSEHSFGEVWPFDVIGKGVNLPNAKNEWGWNARPLVYSAEGSHALYGTPGLHEYILPFGLLSDHSSDGPIWDPTQNFRSFWLNTSTSSWWSQYLTFVPTDENPWPSDVLDYAGRWGDEFWSLPGRQDKIGGQYCYIGNCRYVNGPMGPRYKYLDRRILDPIDFTFDLFLVVSASVLLSVMIFTLIRRIRHPPSSRRSSSNFTHLFPFCFLPALNLAPQPVKRPRMRQRRSTWYPTANERTPLL